MKWKAEYELGIDDIDNEHKKLVEIINEYNSTMSDPKINTSAEMGRILVYLINYTSFHFKNEEGWMLRLKYSGLEEHKEIHKNIVGQLRDILIKMKKKESYTSVEFYYFLMNWLNDHILGEDLKFAKYSKNTTQNLKTLKQTLINPLDIVEHIVVKLYELDELHKKMMINDEDLELRRIIYFEDLFNKYLLNNVESFNNILILLIELTKKGIITNIERNKLYYSLLLDKRAKELEFGNNDEVTKTDIENLLGKLKV